MVLGVALSAFMLFSVFTVGVTYFKMQRVQNIRLSGAEFDAIMYGVTDEQKQMCENNPDISGTGVLAVTGYVEETPADKTPGVVLYWGDDSYWGRMMKPARKWVQGDYPQKEDELMVTEDALERCGYEGKGIGDSITFTWDSGKEIREQTFRISGIWDGYGDTAAFFVSETFFEKTGQALSDVRTGRYHISFKQTIIPQKYQDEFIEKMNLGKQQRLFFTVDAGYSVQILAGIAGLSFVTCLCAYLLIYNIMYLSVAGNIRYYGLLQTIGMTGRQIYALMRRQMFLIGGTGLIAGTALGVGTSFFLIPGVVKALGIRTKQVGDVQISFHPAILILTVLLTGITMWTAYRKPARTAVNCSPLEALLYRPAAGFRESRKTGRGKVIWRLARQQVTKDKKKSAVVMLSLGAGLSVFLCIVTIITSQGARAYNYNYRNLDMVLKNDTITKEEKEERLQIIDEKLLEKIRQTDGVQSADPVIYTEITVPWEPDLAEQWMREFYETWMDISYEEEKEEYKEYPENFGSSLVGIGEADFRDLNETLEQPVDEEAFLNGDACILYRNGLFELKEEDVRGKTVTCAQYDDPDNIRSFQVAGLTDESAYTALLGYPPTIIVTDRVVKEFADEPLVSKVGIRYEEEYDEKTENSILRAVEESPHARDFSFDSKIQLMENVKKAQGNMMEVGMGIAFILAFIGIMNYINTSVGNVQNRQVELSVMESIGMTGKQVRKMLILEGVLYAAGAGIITMTVGLGITYRLYQSMNYNGAEFAIPLLPVLAVFLLVLLACMIVPVSAYRNLEKKAPVVERIRGFE